MPVPPQHRVPDVHDFRATSITKRGYLLKNKRKLDELEVAAEEEAMVVGDGGVLPSGPRTPATKRAKHNVAGLGKARVVWMILRLGGVWGWRRWECRDER